MSYLVFFILCILGMHYSIEMLKAYNIFSKTTAFVGDALRTDARGAYSSVALFFYSADIFDALPYF